MNSRFIVISFPTLLLLLLWLVVVILIVVTTSVVLVVGIIALLARLLLLLAIAVIVASLLRLLLGMARHDESGFLKLLIWSDGDPERKTWLDIKGQVVSGAWTHIPYKSPIKSGLLSCKCFW